MIRQSYRVAGEPVTINTLEREEDLDELREWFSTHGRQVIALDTEGTGLNPFSDDFELRHVQFGDSYTGWVLPADRFRNVITAIIRHPAFRWVLHNAPYDLLVFHAEGIVDANDLALRVEDTKIKAHLVDPRPRHEGGIGLGLKPNTARHVDPTAPDTQSDLHKVFSALDVCADGEVIDLGALDTKERAKLRKELKAAGRAPRRVKVDEGWRYTPLFHPTYTLYAGLDVIYGWRLNDKLTRLVEVQGTTELCRFEHRVLRWCVAMRVRGMLADVPYLTDLEAEYARTAAEHVENASAFGVSSVNATRQVAAALTDMGVTLKERTKKGNPKVDKAVLEGLAKAGNPLAIEIMAAKRAEKWRTAYVLQMLNARDSNDRIHPDINSLQARTARMSISNPPFQQLPSGDWQIRSGIIADPGHVIISCDYDQIEMRVVAAFAGEEPMMQAARDGVSMHKITAKLMFGEEYDKHQYKLAKTVGFGSVYGGGADALHRQAGISLEQAEDVVQNFKDSYPNLTEYKRQRQWDVLEAALSSDELNTYISLRKRFFDAEKDSPEQEDIRRQISKLCRGKYATITTPIGRRVPVDAEFAYKVVNYEVQGTARDMLAAAGVRLHDSDLSDFILLPIHDETLSQAPEKDAKEVARLIGEVMTTEWRGVPITASGEVYGRSWGDGYR